MTAANAGKKHSYPGFFHPHHHYMFNKRVYGPTVIIGTSDYGCNRWLRRYKKTGKKYFLDRYYACID